MVDKPVAGTPAEARELATLAEERGLLLSVFQNRRWDNDFLTLRKLLAEDALGDVWRFESRFERWRPKPKGGWRESGDPAEIGGLLYDLGSHVVDQALVLFGPATQVYAESVVRRAGAEADDDTFIAITHANGVRSTSTPPPPPPNSAPVSASWARRPVTSSTAWTRRRRRCAKASGRAPAGARRTSRCGAASAPGESPITGGGRVEATVAGDYPAYYAAVAKALLDDGPNPVGAREAAAALDVLEAARRSARDGMVVTL